ncbi:MAG: DUF177 domain-containing protein [Nitrospirota bacterium]
MKILISEIPKDGLNLDIEESIDSNIILPPVKTQIKIEKINSEVVIKGELTATVKLQCSRCLKDFEKIINIPIEAIYHPIEELKGDERHEVKSEELDMDFYSTDEMDTAVLIKEQIMLNLSMKPLCADSCKGICIRCGKDLNTGECNCKAEQIDPRLEALKKLLK